MGSFRSQPDLTKHTISKQGLGSLSFAVSNMCGTSPLTQAGESTWKMRTSTPLPFPMPKTLFLESSMDMAVPTYLFRS